MTNEIVKTEGQRSLSPIEQAQNFLTSGGDLANLEKMMELQERWEADQARKAFYEAMTAFKADPPKLKKTRNVAYGNTKYSHADLAEITEEISSALSANGLNATWKTSQDNNISVTCTITHSLGYSESTTLSSAPDTSGGKNSIQAIGSTITYLQRYTLLALTGLAAHGQDDDGKNAVGQKEKPEVKPGLPIWENAKKYYMEHGNFDGIEKAATISDEHKKMIMEECR